MKQRLVGALVLVSAGIVLWSILFTGPAAYKVDRDSQIPPAPITAEPEPIKPKRPENLAEVKEPTPLPEPSNAPAVEEGAEPSEVQSEPAVAAAEKAPEETASAEKNPVLDPETRVPNAWVIQVASFSSEANARKLKNRLRELGYKAYVREAPTPSGKVLQRVFVGPELVKETALKHKVEIEREFKLKALLHKFES